MASLLTPATFIVWSQTQLLFSRSTVSKTTSGIPKAKTPLSFSGQAEVLQDDLRGANTLLSIPGGDEIPLYSPSHVPGGHCDHLEECTYFSRFTKVSTEGSPCQKDMTPSQKPFLLAITRTLGAQTQACQEQRHTCNLHVCSQFVERESLICSHIS